MMSASIVTPRWLAWPVRSAADVVVGPALLRAVEGRVAQVAPEDRGEPELVRDGEGLRDLDDLPLRLGRAEVDRRADRDRAHLARLLDLREGDLVVGVRVAEELVVVELDDERDAVRVLARAGPEHAERRGDGVAAALDRELDDALGVEVVGILGERRARRVLDALVDGEDRDVARIAQATVREDALQRSQHGRRAIRVLDHPLDEVGAGQVEAIARDRRALVTEEVLGVVAEDRFDAADAARRARDGHVRQATFPPRPA